MGAGLGLAWAQAGLDVSVLVRDGRSDPGLPMVVGEHGWAAATGRADVILVAVPDDVVMTVATTLARLGAVTAAHVVLHCSGILDHAALDPLRATGAALGSLHPLMAISTSKDAPGRLRGAFAGVEGDPRASAAAEWLAGQAGMTPARIPPGAKPAYHAAAAMVSNFTVTLYDAARRVAERGGVPADMARRIYLPLLRGTVENLAADEPAVALTGAIRRGDAATVAAHLDAVGPGAQRRLYLELGRATLALAREGGLEPALADRLSNLLRGD